MLVAISLSAMVMGAATITFASISANSKRLSSVLSVEIGPTANNAFYGQNSASANVYSAPSYGRAALAQDFRSHFIEDVTAASLVHCLPRSLPNTVRLEFLRYAAGDPGSTEMPPRLDTAEDFRQYLLKVEPAAVDVYKSAIRNVPSAKSQNTTIFILSPSSDPGFLRFLAIYEIDFVTTHNPKGVYASVRRYKNGSLTHYYDVFYNDLAAPPPVPSFVAFEQTARRVTKEGSNIDRFKVAEYTPFYFVWFPDPSVNLSKISNSPVTSPASSPRASYEALGKMSSLMTVVPMFPQF